MEQATAYLILENGRVFEGAAFGARREAVGELVFTTGMTGYLETITDPSYCGQLVVQTFPLIGNYGVIPADFECTRPALAAYIVREWCQKPSNFRSEGSLGTFLKEQDIPGISGVDTRELVKAIREHGVLNARLSYSPDPGDLLFLHHYCMTDAVQIVGSSAITEIGPEGAGLHVALWDFGAKAGIARELVRRGCRVTLLPPATKAERIRSLAPDGVMLSNGPGDPLDNTAVVGEIRELCTSKVPMFGVCLGHQLLALAQGAKTVRMRYGHRGANQPVRSLETRRVYITSQNHGYAVDTATLPGSAVPSFENANDGTCEGVRYTDMPAYSVQFHPEASGGPLDSAFLFDQFIAEMEARKKCR